MPLRFAELVTAIFTFFASLERRRIIERIAAGLEREGKTLGRPRVIVNRDRVLRLRAEGQFIRHVAAKMRISLGTVRRIDAVA